MEKEKVKLSKFFSILIMVLIVLAFVIPDSMEVQAAGSNQKTTVTVGKTITLKIKSPSKKVKWSVNKPEIAQITKTKGNKKSTAIIKGKKAGKAVVTAKIGKKKQKVTVTVNPKIIPHSHSYTTPATCTQPARCACGLTYGGPLGHQMSPATCKTPQKCIRCGTTVGGVASHNYDTATSRCVWCSQLNVQNFVSFEVSRTSNTGEYNVNYISLKVNNRGLVSFEIVTSMPATIYPSAGAAGTRVYLTDTSNMTYTDANRFVVLPAGEGQAWFDTLDKATTFTFRPEGMLEFYANYGEHTYLFHVNASKVDPDGYILSAGYTFTQIN